MKTEVSAALEAIALIEHFLSLFGDIFTFYFNTNSEILFLCLMNMGQHLLKIVRILFLGFALNDVPPSSCYIHAFINQFTMFTSLAAGCLLIFTLYGAVAHPMFFSKHYMNYRPYTYGFIMVYTALHVFIGLWEPIFIGYDQKHIDELPNCGCGLRDKLYQYLFGSVCFTLPFTIPAVYCSCVIIYKIVVVPRSSIKKQIVANTKMSFTRWIKILCYSVFITLLSFANLFQDVRNGIASQYHHIYNEDDNLGPVYFFTASSGILIFLFTNSRTQIKKKLGYKVDDDSEDYQYTTNPSSSNTSFYKRDGNESMISAPSNVNYQNNTSYATSPAYFNNITSPIPYDNISPVNLDNTSPLAFEQQGSPRIYNKI